MDHQHEHPTAPAITETMRQQARQTPNSWLYIVDPGYQESGDDVRPEGVIGAYRIDEHGEIDERFHVNDGYQPSDLAFALPEPTNELERVLHRIATGEAPETDLPPAVLEADVLLYAPAEDDSQLYAAELSDGSKLVPACTSAARVPETWPNYRTVSGRALPDLLGGLDLGLNLDDGMRAVVPHHTLVEAATRR